MLIDAANKQVAIQVCSDKTRNSVSFSKGEGKQVYAITVKVPVIVVAIRKLIPGIGENESLTFKGKLFAEDKAIIYDVTAGEPVKRRGRRKDSAEDVEETDVLEDDGLEEAAEAVETDEAIEPAEESVSKNGRGRKKKQS